MYPILGASILVLAVSLERIYWMYFVGKADKDALTKTIKSAIEADQIPRALKVLRSSNAPLNRVLHAGIKNHQETSQTVQLLMDESALAEIPRIEARTGYLVMLSNVATLMGLLGTVIGLIASFRAVASASAAEKATALAKGISEAMNCTAFGLIVAIPALLMYAILKSREHRMVDDINEATVTLYNIISERKRAEGAE